MDELSEEERRALRGSKFAPLPPPNSSQTRLAHPGGPLTTNKAAALAKFLERKLKEPQSLNSLDPDIVERAVLNAKACFNSAGSSIANIRHVDSFPDTDEKEVPGLNSNASLSVTPGIQKKKKKKKANKGMLKKKKKQKQKATKQGTGNIRGIYFQIRAVVTTFSWPADSFCSCEVVNWQLLLRRATTHNPCFPHNSSQLPPTHTRNTYTQV